MQKLLLISFIVREVFIHILSRISHPTDTLRQFSLFCARHVIDRILWLKRSCEAAFFLLDGLHELEVLLRSSQAIPSAGEESTTRRGQGSEQISSLETVHYGFIYQQIASRKASEVSANNILYRYQIPLVILISC